MQHVHAQNTAEPVQIGSRRDLKVVIFAPDFHQLKHSGGPPAADTAVGVDLEEAAFLKKMIQPLFVPEEVIVSVYVGNDRNESLAEKNVNDFLPPERKCP